MKAMLLVASWLFVGCAEIGSAIDDVLVGTVAMAAKPFYRPERIPPCTSCYSTVSKDGRWLNLYDENGWVGAVRLK